MDRPDQIVPSDLQRTEAAEARRRLAQRINPFGLPAPKDDRGGWPSDGDITPSQLQASRKRDKSSEERMAQHGFGNTAPSGNLSAIGWGQSTENSKKTVVCSAVPFPAEMGPAKPTA